MHRRCFLALLLATPLAATSCDAMPQAGAGNTDMAAAPTHASTASDQPAPTPSPSLAAPGTTPTPAPSAAPTAVATATPVPTPAAAPSPAIERPAVRLAYLHEGRVFAVDTPTAPPVQLGAGGVPGSLQWKRDGRTLFFSTSTTAPPFPGVGWTWPPSSGFAQAVQTWRWQPGNLPTKVQNGLWSPDGSAVATVQPNEAGDTTTVWVAQRGNHRQVTPTEAGVLWQALAWSPDGRRLALACYTTMHGPHGTLPDEVTLWVTDTTLTNRTQLPLPNPNGEMHSWPDIVRWSPDGQWLLLGVGPGQGCDSCRLDGLPFYALPAGGDQAVSFGHALQDGALAWAPDGQWVVLSQGAKGAAGRETYREKHLSRFDWPSAHQTDLTSDPSWSDVEPAISPNGTQVAFARGHTQRQGETTISAIISRRLWLIGADGGTARQLTDTPGWTDEAPRWSPDGAWILFVRWRPTRPDGAAAAGLWAARPDGSQLRQVLPALGSANVYANGFGYYGTFGWDQQVATAPSA